MAAYGRLDAAILNAGVGLPDPSFRDLVAATDNTVASDAGPWRKMLDINLGAVVEGAWLAVRHMRGGANGKGNAGTILINASAAGMRLPLPPRV
jgi:NAD(P)-dependent dehydrogenase (short-subunit alcohol dehydrogenase family)